MKHLNRLEGDPAIESPPARGRGLKRIARSPDGVEILSPPARGRGLKPGGWDRRWAVVCRPPRGGVD